MICILVHFTSTQTCTDIATISDSTQCKSNPLPGESPCCNVNDDLKSDCFEFCLWDTVKGVITCQLSIGLPGKHVCILIKKLGNSKIMWNDSCLWLCSISFLNTKLISLMHELSENFNCEKFNVINFSGEAARNENEVCTHQTNFIATSSAWLQHTVVQWATSMYRQATETGEFWRPTLASLQMNNNGYRN